MEKLFISHHIAYLIKRQNKWVEVSKSVLLLLVLLILFKKYFINFLVGSQINAAELVAIFAIIYALMNLGYAIFHAKSVPDKNEKSLMTTPVSTIKVSPKMEAEKNNVNEAVILSKKNYALEQTIKAKPQVPESITKAQKNVATSVHENKPLKKAEIENAPPLEVNFESAEGLIEENLEIPENWYAGVIDEDFNSIFEADKADESAPNTQSKDEESHLFNKIPPKKFI